MADRISYDQNKTLLDQQQRKCPNPKIVIGISEASVSDDDMNGTNEIILESPKEQTPTTNTNNLNENSSSNNDCDKLNEKLVPYNGSGGYQQHIPLHVTIINSRNRSESYFTIIS